MRLTKRQLLIIIREERQGYDAREDESLGMRHGPEHDYSQSEEARREDSYGKWGKRSRKRRRYHRQGYDAREDESLGMRRGPEHDYSQSDKDRREDSYGKWGRRAQHENSALKTRIRQIIREVVNLFEDSSGMAIFNQWLVNAAKGEMSEFDSVIASFEGDYPDAAEDVEDVRDTIAYELSLGQPASQQLRKAINNLHPSVRDAIPAAPYFWAFPEEMEDE